MKFSAKFRGRNSPLIFTRSSKRTVAAEAETVAESVKIEPAEENDPTVEKLAEQLPGDGVVEPVADTAVEEESANVTPAKEEVALDAFPNIHVDARQEDDDDSVSIQTEQREDIQSIDSIMTEYEEQQGELRDEAAGNTEENIVVAAAVDGAVVAAGEVVSSPDSNSDEEEKIEFTAPPNGCRASCGKLLLYNIGSCTCSQN